MIPVIREATASDLPSIYRIFLEGEIEQGATVPPISKIPMFLRHELQSGHMVICKEDDEVTGFATTITRGEMMYLAELFVRSDRQSGGAGKLLLRHVLKGADGICTLSSADPKAMALYIRAGMRPLWPNLWLRRDVATETAPSLDNLDVIAHEAFANDPELIGWDHGSSKRRREADHAYWIETGAVPFWFTRDHERIGYGYLQTRNESSLWLQDAITIGPLGAKTPEDAAACLLCAAEMATRRANVVRVAVPGPHQGLRPLLEAGFRITSVETYMESKPYGLDPRLYIGSGDLF